MKQQRRFLYFVLCSTGVAVVILGVVLSTTFLRAHSGASAHGRKHAFVDQNMSSTMPIQPNWNMMQKMTPDQAAQASPAAAFPCLNNTPAQGTCYTPQQFATAYGVQPLQAAGTNGQGMTISIVEGGGDPTIATDLQTFDGIFGLPNPTLNVMQPFGTAPNNGVSIETALDVEWSHAMAPAATIDLIEVGPQAQSAQGSMQGVMKAVQFAAQNNLGSVISVSYGLGESCYTQADFQTDHQIFQQALANKQTVLVSSGDRGSANFQCDANGMVNSIAAGASDPLVTAVGGTTLLAAGGTYTSEATWNQMNAAGGGNFSGQFAIPAYQQNAVNGQSQNRATADVAFDADPATGAPVVDSSNMPGTTLMIPIGGTSLGAPAWAGMTALFDQAAGANLGFMNGGLYRLSQNAANYAQAVHDVTTGNNTVTVQQPVSGQATTIQGFNAGTGWDLPTGIGSPNAAALSPMLPQLIQAGDGQGL